MSRILVAEDEQRIASFIDKGLRASGFAVDSGRRRAGRLRGGDVGRARPAGPRHRPAAPGRVRRPAAGCAAGGADPGDHPDRAVRRERHRRRAGQRRRRLHGQAVPVRGAAARIRLRLRPDARRRSRPCCATATWRWTSAPGGRRPGAATVELSAREYALLEMLLRHAGQVLSREQILSQVWGYDFDPGSNVVDVYIRYLRRKVGAERIETLRGVGYRLREARDAEPARALTAHRSAVRRRRSTEAMLIDIGAAVGSSAGRHCGGHGRRPDRDDMRNGETSMNRSKRLGATAAATAALLGARGPRWPPPELTPGPARPRPSLAALDAEIARADLRARGPPRGDRRRPRRRRRRTPGATDPAATPDRRAHRRPDDAGRTPQPAPSGSTAASTRTTTARRTASTGRAGRRPR